MSHRHSLTEFDLDNTDEKGSFLESGASLLTGEQCRAQTQHSNWKWRLATCTLLVSQLVMLVYMFIADKKQQGSHWLPSELGKLSPTSLLSKT